MPVNYEVVLCGRYSADESRVIIPHSAENDGEYKELGGKKFESTPVPLGESARK